MDTFKRKLDIYLRARFTLIIVVTPEEQRAIQAVKEVSDPSNRTCLAWDAADGFAVIAGKTDKVPQANDPLQALFEVEKGEDGVVYVLKDLHDFLDIPQVKRKLRNLAQQLVYTKKSLIVATPLPKIPDELQDEAVILRLPAPSVQVLDQVRESLAQTPGVKVEQTPGGRDKIVQAAMGMTASQAQRVFAKAIVTDGSLHDGDVVLVTVTEDILHSLRRQVPLSISISQRENVEGLRQWLREGRAQSASFAEMTEAEERFAGIPLELPGER